MAFQHFYSRVPARVSMYNKADGFDTFAKSADLDKEFLERELAAVYENKLNKNDVAIIRMNKMPCVYTQNCTKSGKMLQNCISYIPHDYTGERSSYLSHTLVFTEKEKDQILLTQDDNALNLELFMTNIEDFQITSANAVPNDNYPEKEYSGAKSRESGYMLLEMNKDTVDSFIYSILYAICGKGRNVCIKLAGDEAELSRKSVQIFNEILSVLPHNIRPSLSFASYVTEPSQYANYKLRGVSSEFPENSAKCVCIDMQTNLVIGVQYDEVVANKSLINFFYLLLENKTIRAEFLKYMKGVTDAIPTLQSLNLKVLSSLVFLFQYSSGLFEEQEVLPDDNSIYDYLCAYEKYRTALNEEYRVQTYRCLLRYPASHLAIPRNIFAKISRLYPDESAAAKRIVMDTVLELIHTDIMRDKLFAFIKSNYQSEDKHMKQLIMVDLCRVFYGGFLQNSLLSFFSSQFENESDEVQALILEKLLLSIRTLAVQGKILEFIDDHYSKLDEAPKDAFYNTYIEMLPECDGLSNSLTQMVNKYIGHETAERKEKLTERMIEVIDLAQSRNKAEMLPILANNPGLSENIVIRLAFGEKQNEKIRKEYVKLISSRSVADKTAFVINAFKLVPNINSDSFIEDVKHIFEADIQTQDLYVWLEMSQKLSKMPKDFAEKLNKTIILKAVCNTVCDVLDTEKRIDGKQMLNEYINQNESVRECERYSIIFDYDNMINAAKRADYAQVDESLTLVLNRAELLDQMAKYIEKCELNDKELSKESRFCIKILQNILTQQTAGLDKLYNDRIENESADDRIIFMITLCSVMANSGKTLHEKLFSEESGMEKAIESFLNDHNKGAFRWLRTKLRENSEINAEFEEMLKKQNKKRGNFFTRLFKRNK